MEENTQNKGLFTNKDTFYYLKEEGYVGDQDSLGMIYNQFHYEPTEYYTGGYSTPTTIVVYPKGSPYNWCNIREIRYAHDVSYNALTNPKVTFFRNKNNTCNILLNFEKNKNIIHGINEQNIIIGNNSFSIYHVLEYPDSFNNNIPRLIYIDNTGLYIVPKNQNSLQDIIIRYHKKEKLEFNDLADTIRISALNGDIHIGNNPMTKNNFFEIPFNSDEEPTQIHPNQILRSFLFVPENNGARYRDDIGMYILKEIIYGKAKRKILSKEECEQLISNGLFYSILATSSLQSSNYIGAKLKSLGYTNSYNFSFEKLRECSYAFKNPEIMRKFKETFSEMSLSNKYSDRDSIIVFKITENL
ncbi:hypothetical protein PIROE2DRAFT_13127 [Piromyces sp. E2]|nr:hypothetical protein PIROE2DRAFT_13127 [Piromyces sp. E2]|eukprot:OUM60969.1 hypothetical protein PIROE2DRAFT_13127 [Piromyces sp. E2]